jgi:hypothetical protein
MLYRLAVGVTEEFFTKRGRQESKPEVDFDIVFGVDYFIQTYCEDQELLAELENMRDNIDSQVEYYASYKYLRSLFQR